MQFELPLLEEPGIKSLIKHGAIFLMTIFITRENLSQVKCIKLCLRLQNLLAHILKLNYLKYFVFVYMQMRNFKGEPKVTDQVLVNSLWTIFDNETAINKIKNMSKRIITTFYFCALYMIS